MILTDTATFLTTLIALEEAFIAAYMAAAQIFSSLGQHDLVQLAIQIGATEAEHRAHARFYAIAHAQVDQATDLTRGERTGVISMLAPMRDSMVRACTEDHWTAPTRARSRWPPTSTHARCTARSGDPTAGCAGARGGRCGSTHRP